MDMSLTDNDKRNYITSAIFSALVIWIVNWAWPGTIPIPTFSLWSNKGGVVDWLALGLPLFVWGFVIQTILEFVQTANRNPLGRLLRGRLFVDAGPSPGALWVGRMVLAAWAGFMEEVCFRWLIFLSAIVGVKVTNWIFLGFVDVNVVRWIYVNVLCAFADLTTFHHLHDVLFHPSSWAVGAAVISANAFFRDGHKYQGILGVLNSWFAGMFFFWMMFAHGLWAAIVVHFTYDVVVFTVATLGYSARR